MKQLRKALLIAGIVCVGSAMFSFAQLFSDIFYFQAKTYYIVLDGVYAALSIITGIIFWLCKTKRSNKLLTKKPCLSRFWFWTYLIISLCGQWCFGLNFWFHVIQKFRLSAIIISENKVCQNKKTKLCSTKTTMKSRAKLTCWPKRLKNSTNSKKAEQSRKKNIKNSKKTCSTNPFYKRN